MTITFGTMLNQMTGLFVLLVIGFLMNRLHILPEAAEAVLSKLSTKLCLPALMLFTFMEECTVQNLTDYANVIKSGDQALLQDMLRDGREKKATAGGN